MSCPKDHVAFNVLAEHVEAEAIATVSGKLSLASDNANN